MRTVLCDMLGIRYPIVQDGMGPFSTAALAAAVSDAGGLGTVSIPGMLLEPARAERLMRAEIDRTASLTDGGFAVGNPTLVFTPVRNIGERPYDVLPDGKHFLVMTHIAAVQDAPATKLRRHRVFARWYP